MPPRPVSFKPRGSNFSFNIYDVVSASPLGPSTIDIFAAGDSRSDLEFVTTLNSSVEPAASESGSEKFQPVYGFIIPFIIAACFVALCLNAFVLLLIRWLRKPLSPNILLTMGLATADLWGSFCMATGFVLHSYLPYFFGIFINSCINLSFEAFRLGAVLTSAFYLLLLALNHYLAIAYPMKHNRILSRRVTKLVMSAVFLLPPCGFFVAFASQPGEAFQSEEGECAKINFYNALPFRATVSSLFVVPFAVIALLYCAMYRELQAASKRQEEFKRPNSDTRKATRDIRRKKRTLQTTMIMVLSFVIGWFPSVASFFLTSEELGVRQLIETVDGLMVGISATVNLLIVAKFFVNPIIYALRIPEIQEALRTCLRVRTSLRSRSYLSESKYTCEASWTDHSESGHGSGSGSGSGGTKTTGAAHDHDFSNMPISPLLAFEVNSTSPCLLDKSIVGFNA